MAAEKESGLEKVSKFYRNWNALGAVALGGLAILAPPVASGVLAGLAGINAVQAGAGEIGRRYAKKKRLKGQT